MLDREMTRPAAGAPRAARLEAASEPRLRASRPIRAARPVRSQAGPDPVPLRHEVVVQGMRITLPALRFMNHSPPGAGGR
ncbi:MAG: hypothetical protein ACFE0R_19305 [Salinarimonas sp.]